MRDLQEPGAMILAAFLAGCLCGGVVVWALLQFTLRMLRPLLDAFALWMEKR